MARNNNTFLHKRALITRNSVVVDALDDSAIDFLKAADSAFIRTVEDIPGDNILEGSISPTKINNQIDLVASAGGLTTGGLLLSSIDTRNSFMNFESDTIGQFITVDSGLVVNSTDNNETFEFITKISSPGVTGTEPVVVAATGGDTTSTATVNSVEYKFHEYTTAGTHTFTVTEPGFVDVLIVGGGGGGGGGEGGGGGGGGVLISSRDRGEPGVFVEAGTYTVHVGEGGPGGDSLGYSDGTMSRGGNGDSSSVFGFKVFGGGGGGGRGDSAGTYSMSDSIGHEYAITGAPGLLGTKKYFSLIEDARVSTFGGVFEHPGNSPSNVSHVGLHGLANAGANAGGQGSVRARTTEVQMLAVPVDSIGPTPTFLPRQTEAEFQAGDYIAGPTQRYAALVSTGEGDRDNNADSGFAGVTYNKWMINNVQRSRNLAIADGSHTYGMSKGQLYAGFRGGAYDADGTTHNTGGGGGAAGVGGDATGASAGGGGDGIQITNFESTNYYYGGGGSGIEGSSAADPAAVGGQGGGGGMLSGGTGGRNDGGSGTGAAGGANTGGGGGAGFDSDDPGGPGGSGIVVIRYETAGTPRTVFDKATSFQNITNSKIRVNLQTPKDTMIDLNHFLNTQAGAESDQIHSFQILDSVGADNVGPATLTLQDELGVSRTLNVLDSAGFDDDRIIYTGDTNRIILDDTSGQRFFDLENGITLASEDPSSPGNADLSEFTFDSDTQSFSRNIHSRFRFATRKSIPSSQQGGAPSTFGLNGPEGKIGEGVSTDVFSKVSNKFKFRVFQASQMQGVVSGYLSGGMTALSNTAIWSVAVGQTTQYSPHDPTRSNLGIQMTTIPDGMYLARQPQLPRDSRNTTIHYPSGPDLDGNRYRVGYDMQIFSFKDARRLRLIPETETSTNSVEAPSNSRAFYFAPTGYQFMKRQKFPFAGPYVMSDVDGDLSMQYNFRVGHSSSTKSYISAMRHTNPYDHGTPLRSGNGTTHPSSFQDEFPFANETQVRSNGNTLAIYAAYGTPITSPTHGYIAGGEAHPRPNAQDGDNTPSSDPAGQQPNPTYRTFPYGPGNIDGTEGPYAWSFPLNGPALYAYTSPSITEVTGNISNDGVNRLRQKFPFSGPTGASRVPGDLAHYSVSAMGNASETKGYITGIAQDTGPTGTGTSPSAYPGSRDIDNPTWYPGGDMAEFSFASDTSITSLPQAAAVWGRNGSSQNSPTHGYTAGGWVDWPNPVLPAFPTYGTPLPAHNNPAGGTHKKRQKFPFAGPTAHSIISTDMGTNGVGHQGISSNSRGFVVATESDLIRDPSAPQGSNIVGNADVPYNSTHGANRGTDVFPFASDTSISHRTNTMYWWVRDAAQGYI